MHAIIILVALASSAFAAHNFVDVTEDTLGGYNLSYKTDDAYKTEVRHEDGTVSGAYSYVDPDGNLQSFKYTAGRQGFRPSGPSIPQPVVTPITETPEVILARKEHLALVDTIKERPVIKELPYELLELPQPDFIVVLAKALHTRVPIVLEAQVPELKSIKKKKQWDLEPIIIEEDVPEVQLIGEKLSDSYKFTLGH